MLPIAQVWSHRMDDVLHLRDAERACDNCTARGTRLQETALGRELMHASSIEDGPADAIAVAKLLVGGVDDGVHVDRGDVAASYS